MSRANPNSSYYKYVVEFEKKEINKKDIINTNIYKHLTEIHNFSLKDNLFTAKVKSMCMEKDPTKLRIRNDKFLQYLSINKNCCLLAFFEHNSRIHWIFYYGWSFYGYNKLTNVSNSFINFDYTEFINNYLNPKGNIQIKNVIDKKKRKTKYIFYTCCDEYFDEENFNSFLNVVSNSNYNPYDDNNDKLKSDKPIPSINIENAKKNFNNLCAIYKALGKQKCFVVDWENQFISDELRLDLHHFIPKSYFKNYMTLVDWNVIHSEINLVPLCTFCHKTIHGKKDKEAVTKKFYSIIDTLKICNLYDKFFEFMIQNTEFKDEKDLLNFYLK